MEPEYLRPQHEVTLRVRYEETDTMQVVYYSKYLVWFEVGRVELLRHLGLAYRELEEAGVRIPVVEVKATYRSPARFDDEVLVRTRVGNVGNASLRFENEVYRLPEMKLLCSGHTVHVMVDKKGRPMNVPLEMKRKLVPSS